MTKAESLRKWRLAHPEAVKEAQHRYYLTHKGHQKQSVMARKQERLALTNRLKCVPCMDCHKTYNPWIMQFDHRDPKTKVDCIALMVNQCYSMKRIKEEIEKCDVVCANCHAERTHNRRIICV